MADVRYGLVAVMLLLVPTRWATADGQAEQSNNFTAVLADYVVIDKSDRVLVLYSRGNPIRTYRGIQLGDSPEGHKQFEGDERTPEGTYLLDFRNPQSSYHLSLHISYPNTDDRAFARARGRSPGGAIFIHGQPNWLAEGRLPGDWTDGCIALDNAEIDELWQLVPDGTPIKIQA